MSPSGVELGGLQRLPYLKYYNVLKWESKFTFGLNTAKNTHYIKKSFKLKLLNIKFCTKKSVSAHVYLLQEWS